VTRILGVADLHIGATHLTTLDEQRAALEAVVRIAREERVDVVCIAGDGTHHARPTPETLDLLGDFYGALADLNVDVVEIAGNHNPQVPAVTQHFRGHIHVAIQPRIVSLEHLPLDIACLPWLPDAYVRATGAGQLTREQTAHRLTNAAREILAGFRAARRRGVPMVLVAHGTVAGTTTSTGWSMGFMPGTAWVIPTDELMAFEFVIAGHIHRHQEPETNIVVPGSLLPLDFSEEIPTVVVIADVEQGRASWESRLVGGPRVGTVTVAVDDEIGRSSLDAILAGGMNWPDKVRFRLKCDEATAREYPPARISKALYDAGAKFVQVELEVERPDRAPTTGDDAALPVPALSRYLGTRDDLGREQIDRVLMNGIGVVDALRAEGRADAGGDVEVRAIEARDFLGVREAALHFDGHGVYALTGPVGAGKSTVGADALRFALFGASRYGAKVSDQVIRQGADDASAVVILEGVDGRTYRVIRKVKRTARGASSTLDVLADGGHDGHRDWMPLSSGKVADGQAQIDRILGGLTDDTLVASSIVVQRNADAFMRARPEERKQLLAQAAGLSMFDELTEATRTNLRAAETTLGQLHATAAPLRTRAALISMIEQGELKVAETAEAEASASISELEQKVADTRAEYDRNDARASEYDRVLEDAQALKRDVDAVDQDVRGWAQKKALADAIVTERAKLLQAREALTITRGSIAELEASLVAAATRSQERSAALTQKRELEWTFENVKRTRERAARELDEQITAATKQEDRLSASECPVIARISSGELAACLFLRDAKRDAESIPALAERLSAASEVTQAELDLADRIRTFVIPDEPDTRLVNEHLTAARASARDLERLTVAAEKIARAEQVIVEHDEAIARLAVRRAELEARREAKNLTLLDYGDARAAANRAAAEWESATSDLAAARSRLDAARSRAGELRGRLTELRAAAAELVDVEQRIAIVAADVAALEVLVTAWRACRVNVLEASVIPAVEDTANDVLRRFPYGLQIALNTQRERRSGEGVSEALDVEVLGGHAPVYEGCSGGQRTTIDFALHVAIALVVSRRASSRLRFLFADEPEGLDEPGRAAFAATARWIHEAFGLTVVVASHASDLIDALGGQRIDVVAGDNGSTVVAA
jgi:exonuclease SbcD